MPFTIDVDQGRIACKDFHGHGAAVFAGEQAEDDLFLALFLVPGVAILGQLEGFAFDVCGGNIRERALLEVPPSRRSSMMLLRFSSQSMVW